MIYNFDRCLVCPDQKKTGTPAVNSVIVSELNKSCPLFSYRNGTSRASTEKKLSPAAIKMEVELKPR